MQEATLERQRQAKLQSELNLQISRQIALKKKRKILPKQHGQSRQNSDHSAANKVAKKKTVEMDFGR